MEARNARIRVARLGVCYGRTRARCAEKRSLSTQREPGAHTLRFARVNTWENLRNLLVQHGAVPSS